MEILPVFTSHHSIGASILTLETDIYKKINELQPNGTFLPKKTNEIELKEPISIFAISKKHDLKQVILVESDISSYWKFYKGTKEFGLQPIYGLKIKVTGESERSDSNVIVFLKNSQAYYDMVPLYSHACTQEGRQITWDNLQKFWTPNFTLAFPFYSSFIARNLMKHEYSAYPVLSEKMKPVFLVQQQGLPFDQMILEATEKWCKNNDVNMEKAHQVYYYRNEDVMKHQTIQCIRKIPRTNWDKPNLEHYSSNQFSFESFLRDKGETL